MVAPSAAAAASDVDTAEATSPTTERDSLRRALRDLEAAEQRVQRNAERVYDEARGKLVFDLLPVLDNLDRTIRAASQAASSALLDGARMVRAQLEQVLVRYGAEPIAARGQRFDPAIHDAIAAIPVFDPNAHNQVVDEIEPGYRYRGRVLRPAKVAVGVLQRRY